MGVARLSQQDLDAKILLVADAGVTALDITDVSYRSTGKRHLCLILNSR